MAVFLEPKTCVILRALKIEQREISREIVDLLSHERRV